ncbi:MAG: glycosyltransferase [Chloroflexi bacterium]|nr:glycosyltransferase [Chloroflexota bacterium]
MTIRSAQIVATAGRSGVESVLRTLCLGLPGCTLISFENGPLVAELRAAGVDCHVLPVRSKFDLGAVRRLRDLLRAERFDVVHTHGARAMFIGNLAAQAARRHPIVTTLHEFSDTRAYQTRLYWLYDRIERLLARTSTDALVAISDAVLADAVEVRAVPPGKIARIYSGIALDRFFRLTERASVADFRGALGIQPGAPVVGVVGRLAPIKGQAYVIEAFPAVQQVYPGACLVVVGSGPDEPALRALAASLKVPVVFAGAQSEINLVYNALDVLVVPSLSETLGLVALEALLSGTPLVASNVGGLPEIARHCPTSTRLVPPADPPALAQAIIALLRARPQAAAAEIEALRQTFSAENFVAATRNLYQRLLDARR